MQCGFFIKQDILIWSTNTSDMTSLCSPWGTISSLLHSFLFNCTPQSSEQNTANTSNSMFQMSMNKWVGWEAKWERKTRGWLAKGMNKKSWGINGGREGEGGARSRQGWELTRGGRNGEGQLNIHYLATGEKPTALLLLCVGLQLTQMPRNTSTVHPHTHTQIQKHT